MKSVFHFPSNFLHVSSCYTSLYFGTNSKIYETLIWRKYGMEDKGTTLIAWEKVCKHKYQGGLGILDVGTHNKAPMMKNLHKFFNKGDPP
jgi:hypothetical protein